MPPSQRTVFILREAPSYDYPAIAEVLQTSQAPVASPSRGHVATSMRVDPGSRCHCAGVTTSRRFLDAGRGGRLEDLRALLAQDVIFWGDGGGKTPAITQPMHGARGGAVPARADAPRRGNRGEP